MRMQKRKNSEKIIELRYLRLPEYVLPVEVYYEDRNSARVSFGKDKGIVRLPLHMGEHQKEEHLQWAKSWFFRKLNEDPMYRQRYRPKNYATGKLIQLRNREFVLDVRVVANRKMASGRLQNNVLQIRMPSSYDFFERQKACASLISKVLSQYFLPEFSERVHELNDLHFQKKINKIKFKYNHSNWGSCSANGNLNFSSRLLLTPQFITDYVIIHELAHLVHMDHSKDFWNRVAKAMPDYATAEAWLRKFGEKCHW